VIANVRVWDEPEPDQIGVRCSTILSRSRLAGTTTYAGMITYRLRLGPDGLRIVLKRVTLDHHTLRDSGGVLSILI
jgi:3-phenylpropionate/cinnamic acid dioxygenase small subunit